MKKTCIILPLLLAVTGISPCLAQENTQYATFSLDNGVAIPINTSGQKLTASFPYKSPDNNGVSTSYHFAGEIKRPFSKPQYYWGLNCDLGFNNHFYTGKLVTSIHVFDHINNGISYYTLGYGHIWALQPQQQANDKGEYIRPLTLGASISATLFNRKEILGAIDNAGITINAFGKDISPDFKATSGKTVHYCHSKELVPVYSQTAYGLTPQISLDAAPCKSPLRLQLDLSLFLPVFYSGGLGLYETDEFYSSRAASSHGLKQNVTVSLDNKPCTTPPCRMASLQIGLKIGMQYAYQHVTVTPKA